MDMQKILEIGLFQGTAGGPFRVDIVGVTGSSPVTPIATSVVMPWPRTFYVIPSQRDVRPFDLGYRLDCGEIPRNRATLKRCRMPRKSVWPPRISQHKGYSRVWVPAHSGRPGYWLQLGKSGSPEAIEAYKRLLAERPSATDFEPTKARSKLLVQDICDRFSHHYATLPRHATSLERVRLALGEVLQLYGSMPADEFRGPQLKVVQRALAGRGLTVTYIRGLISCIRQAWRHAASEDWIPVELYQALATVRGVEAGEAGCRPPTVVEPVPVADVRAILPHVRPPIAAMVQLQLFTGMRPGEVQALTPGEIVRSGVLRLAGRGHIEVEQLGGVWVYAKQQHKNRHRGHDRMITIGPQAQAILRPWLDGREPTAFCFSPREDWLKQLEERAAGRATPLYPSHQRRRERAAAHAKGQTRGLRYSKRTYLEAIQRACDKADIKPWHPHQLRHTAEMLIEAEHGMDAARAVLGHKDPRVTARYGVRDVLTAAKVMATMG
jgi:integrase